MTAPLIVPLSPIPSQQVAIVLNEQNCLITIRQLGDAMYMTLVVDNVTVFSNLLVNNASPMPPFSTADFKGKLVMLDTVEKSHPAFDQLGERFILMYDYDD